MDGITYRENGLHNGSDYTIGVVVDGGGGDVDEPILDDRDDGDGEPVERPFITAVDVSVCVAVIYSLYVYMCPLIWPVPLVAPTP